MTKLKVITLVGTRPEIIRLSQVIFKLDKYCEHILVHSGQNYDYELNEVFFKDLNIRKPDIFLNSASDKNSPMQVISNIIAKVDEVLEKENPDCFIILGDTNSCLSVIAAKRRKIPIFHLEAGNRCFDLRVPEEINRKIVDHTSDVNLTYSKIAREYLLKEGLNPDLVIKVGSPMNEIITINKEKINNSQILDKFNLTKYQYFLFSFHREENIESDKSMQSIIKILNRLQSEFELPIIVSTHPRTRKKISEGDFYINKNIVLSKPLGFHDYLKLQINSKVVISDSGTITEESSICNFPALNLRESHERPEGMEEGAVIFTGLNLERIIESLKILNDQGRGAKRTLNIVDDYLAENVSDKIIRIIYSYTDYVNRVVWKKY